MTCGRGTGPSLGSGLVPRLKQLQNAQLFQTVRGLRPARKRRSNATFTTDAISGNLRASDWHKQFPAMLGLLSNLTGLF